MWQTDNAYTLLRELRGLDNPPKEASIEEARKFLDNLNSCEIMPDPDVIYFQPYEDEKGIGDIVFKWLSEDGDFDIEICFSYYDSYPEFRLVKHED